MRRDPPAVGLWEGPLEDKRDPVPVAILDRDNGPQLITPYDLVKLL